MRVKPQYIFEFVSSVSVDTDESRESAQNLAEIFLECLESHVDKHVDPDAFFVRRDGFEISLFGLSGNLAKMLNEARAEGMGEALEIMRDYVHSIAAIEKAIAERQAALRSAK